MLGLITHCGAQRVDRAEIGQVVLPASTKTHQPIAHDYMADLIEDRLNDNGLKIVQSEFALGRNGADMFGIMEVGSARSDEFATVIGFRNSHVKKLSAGLVLGKGVFVCDNLCFSGEVKFGRRHTANILDDLPDLVTDAIGRIMGISPRTVDTYRKRLMDKLDLHTLADVVRYAVRTGKVS